MPVAAFPRRGGRAARPPAASAVSETVPAAPDPGGAGIPEVIPGVYFRYSPVSETVFPVGFAGHRLQDRRPRRAGRVPRWAGPHARSGTRCCTGCDGPMTWAGASPPRLARRRPPWGCLSGRCGGGCGLPCGRGRGSGCRRPDIAAFTDFSGNVSAVHRARSAAIAGRASAGAAPRCPARPRPLRAARQPPPRPASAPRPGRPLAAGPVTASRTSASLIGPTVNSPASTHAFNVGSAMRRPRELGERRERPRPDGELRSGHRRRGQLLVDDELLQR